jgi:uncharacterized protein (TIGR02217 family)
MAFFECEFPRTIGYHAVGGPGFSTVVNQGFSGQEQRNRNWANSRGKWNISLMTPATFEGNRQAFIDLLLGFFLNVAGKTDSFRLKDHKDFKAVGQTIGVGSGALQLIKTYTVGGRSYIRTITKPVTSAVVDFQGIALADTVKIYYNGTLQSGIAAVDATTGIYTSTAGGGVVVTADFEFHYPVRFDTDDLPVQVEPSDVADGHTIVSANSIPLVEVTPPNY